MAFWTRKQVKRTPGVQRMDGHEMENYLKRHPTVLYQYTGNTLGFMLLLTLSLAFAGIALYTWFDAPALNLWHWGIVGAMASLSLVLAAVLIYWLHYTRVHYLATSDLHLMIGNGSQVTALSWSELNTESLDFSASGGGEQPGVLTLSVGEKDFYVRIFSRYAALENLHAFIAAVLTQITD